MSEPAPERPPARRGGGNVLTHKLGPLPTWVWVSLIALILIGWSFWKSKTQAKQQATAAAGQGTADTADVPQFVNQTYTTVTPPQVSIPAPQVTVTDTDTGAPSPVPTVRPPAPKPPVTRSPGHPVQPPVFNATYVVRKGETLDEIAKKYKITRVELAHANGLGTGAGLRTGQKIKVPSPAPGGTPNKAI